jgi:cyanate permease
MSEKVPKPGDWTFGDRLARMQEFSVENAKKYREEIDHLLLHRVPLLERWFIGAVGVIIGADLLIFGILFATLTPPEDASFDQSRVILGIAFAATGVGMGSWLLYIAIKGSYDRRLGDVMGVLIALIFGCGLGLSLAWLALGTRDELLRWKLILASGGVFALMAGCIALTILQRMYRETQKRLLRIEYNLAEILDGR